MRTLTRLAAASVAIVVTTGLTVSGAHAQTKTLEDRHGDASVQPYVTPLDRSTIRKNGKIVDLAGLRVNHGKRYVSVRVVFANLKDPGVEVVVQLQASRRSPRYYVRAYASPDRSLSVDRVDGPSRCGVVVEGGPKASVTVKRGRNGYVKIQVPRSCLGTPSKVRARAGSSGSFETGLYTDQVAPRREYWQWTGFARRG